MTKDEQRDSPSIPSAAPLSAASRCLVLAAAFLGWAFAGAQMASTTLVMRPAMIDLLGLLEPLNKTNEASVGQWFAWLNGAFLLGAAAGGLVFGWIGDRLGRSRAMGLSILWFSLFSGVTYFAQSPVHLILLRLLVGLGIGGTWPNGVALVSEAWANASRPMLAGAIGAAGNVGIGGMAALGMCIRIKSDDWQWTMLVGASPIVLALLVFVLVPESPRWLARRGKKGKKGSELFSAKHPADRSEKRVLTPFSRSPVLEVFRPPLLAITLIGIVLGAVPLIGGWGSANWLVPWAQAEMPDSSLGSATQFWRSVTSIIGSLLGGWVASQVGRRSCYFLISVGSLVTAQYLFRFSIPGDGQFLVLVAALGLFNGMYFGWLPLFLPELFPTDVRSTGAGVTYNFGRILTVATLLATGATLEYFKSDYAQIGTVTSFIFAIGMVAILAAPDTTGRQLED